MRLYLKLMKRIQHYFKKHEYISSEFILVFFEIAIYKTDKNYLIINIDFSDYRP